jgi:hypothetical protein
MPSKPFGTFTWYATVTCPLFQIFSCPLCSVKNSLPSGANCNDHGTVNPLAMTSVVTVTDPPPPGGGVGGGVGVGVGAGVGVGVGIVVVVVLSPEPHATMQIVSTTMAIDARKRV